MNIIANEYLNNMGFDQHQHAIFRHYDADHPHIHILVNRIGYDGTVISDSKDYQRSEKVLRELEKQHGLTEVISSRQAQERAMTKNELEMMKRMNVPSSKMQLQEIIKDVLSKKPDAAQFINALEAKGINVLFNQASTGFISGISYGYEGMQFKGAHLGNAYKWQAIKMLSVMNKKQIAQQFTRQMLGQETGNDHQKPVNPPQEGQQPELTQIQKLLPEIEKLYSKALENYRIRSEQKIADTSRRLELMDSQATNLAFQIKSIVYSAEQISKANNKVGSRWVIRLYLVAILSGVCSALITLLVIWIKVH